MEIVVKRGEEEFGPFSPEELREHLAKGTILAEDWAWHDDLSDWVPAKKLIDNLPVLDPVSVSPPGDNSPPAPLLQSKVMGKGKLVAALAVGLVIGGGLTIAVLKVGFTGTKTPLGNQLITGNSVGKADGNGDTSLDGKAEGGDRSTISGTTGIVEVPPSITPPSGDVPASYSAITQKLDKQGSFYFYLSTDQAQKWVETAFTEGANLVKEVDLNSQDVSGGSASLADGIVGDILVQLAPDFELGQAIYSGLGLDSIDGIGASTRHLGSGLKRNVAVIHHDPSKGEGLLWKAFGSAGHELAAPSLMPLDTAYAFHGDLDLKVLLQWAKAMVVQHGTPELKESIIAKLKNPELLAALNGYAGELGFYITLDSRKSIQVPFNSSAQEGIDRGQPGNPALVQTMIEIPEPGMIVTVKVKDDSVQKMVQGLLPPEMHLQPVDLGGIVINQLPQTMPLAMPFQPTVFRVGDYFVITSTPALAQKVIAVYGGQDQGLKGTNEFQAVSKGIAMRGNHLVYMSGRATDLYTMIAKQYLSTGGGNEVSGPIGEMLMKLIKGNSPAALSIMEMGTEGMVLQSHTAGMGFDTVALAGMMVMPVALGGAVWNAGSFAEGLVGPDEVTLFEQKMNSGRELGVGMAQYHKITGRLPEAESWSDDILAIIKDRKHFTDPVFASTAGPGEKVCIWLFNKHLGGVKMSDIEDPANTVLLYDAGLDWNGSAGKEEFSPDDKFKIITVFADGSVRALGPKEARQIKWMP